MASQNKTYDQKKLLGQIYTPEHIVEKILRDTGFYELNFATGSTLDPACGDGRFLVPIARFMIENLPREQLIIQLNNIHGWDISPGAILLCRQNLDDLVAPLDIRIDWHLRVVNALEQIDTEDRYDLIIGNPPYIRIQHLPLLQREYIQAVYSFCRKGSTDTYIAFFQLASVLLKNTGICGFVTPNSFFTSETGKPLRSYFAWNQNLRYLTNYGPIRVFGNTGTYAAITVFGKQKNDHFQYEISDANWRYSSRKIPFSSLGIQSPWHLSITQSENTEGKRLGEICKISVGITTLSDRFYLFSILERSGHLTRALSKAGSEVWIETHLLKPIVKGSKLKKTTDPITEFILFPYEADRHGKHKIIPEQLLMTNYPNAYAYFTSIKNELGKRDNGKQNSVAWYAFGRAQGLDSSFGKKIIFSPMNRFPNFVLSENPDCTVYSGYFIKYEGDYDLLLTQLNSQRMADFMAVAGRDFQGGYKAYNKKAVENFIVEPLSKN